MKKPLLLVPFTALFALTAQAQLVITEADFASPGDAVYMGKATNLPLGTTVGGTGTGQTWNFSAFVPSDIDTVNFSDPSVLPAYGSFPASNISFRQMNGDAYINKSAAGLELFGFSGRIISGGPIITAPFSPTETIIKFPAQMGVSYTDTATINLTLDISANGQGYVDSIHYIRNYYITNSVDAEGALTLPIGTYSALRSKVDETTIDSIWVHAQNDNPLFGIVQGWQPLPPFLASIMNVSGPVTVKIAHNYRWLANNSKFYLVDMEMDSTGTTPVKAAYREDPTTPLQTAINENAANTGGIKLYPNPANGEVFMTVPTAGDMYTMNIYNSMGQLVLSRFVDGSKWYDISVLKAGVYVVTISNAKHSLTQTLVKN